MMHSMTMPCCAEVDDTQESIVTDQQKMLVEPENAKWMVWKPGSCSRTRLLVQHDPRLDVMNLDGSE